MCSHLFPQVHSIMPCTWLVLFVAALGALSLGRASAQELTQTCGSCNFTKGLDATVTRAGNCADDCMGTLNLDRRGIASIVDGAFADLPALQGLYLNANSISAVAVGTFADLQSLQTLNLGSNRISTVTAETLEGMPALRMLYLNANRISALSAGTFAGKPLLQTLQLAYNQISDVAPRTFEGLVGLKNLFLFGNKISTVSIEAFVGLPALQELRLNANQISAVAAGTFADLQSLQTLNLESNQISTVTAGMFGTLRLLRTLLLRSNQISTVEEGMFAELPALETLDLGSNQISDIVAGTWEGLPALHTLRLDGNLIMQHHPEAFRNLPALQFLEIHDNELGCVFGVADDVVIDQSVGASGQTPRCPAACAVNTFYDVDAAMCHPCPAGTGTWGVGAKNCSAVAPSPTTSRTPHAASTSTPMPAVSLPTTSDKCNLKAVMDELQTTDDPELRMAAASDTCSNTESAVLAAFYSRYSKTHACRNLWGPSYLKPTKC